MELSVIVPVGRSTKNIPFIISQLDRAIKSSLEIIFILDGFVLEGEECSSNYFFKFLLDLSLTRDIKIISLKHKSGPGVARNAGINSSSGNWLLFIDDDDLLLNISNVFIPLDQSIDLYLFPFKDEEGFMDNDLLYDSLSANRKNETEEFIKLLLDTGFFINHIQQFLYNRNFIVKNKIFFPATYLCEDLTFNTLAITLSKNIGSMNSFLYFYRKGDSTTKKISSLERSYDPVICIKYLKLKIPDKIYCLEVRKRLLLLFLSRSIYEIMISSSYSIRDNKDIKTEITKIAQSSRFIFEIISNKNVILYCDGPVSNFVKEILLTANMNININIINDFNIHTVDRFFDHHSNDTVLIIANIQTHLAIKIKKRILNRWPDYNFSNNKLIMASNFICEFNCILDILLSFFKKKHLSNDLKCKLTF